MSTLAKQFCMEPDPDSTAAKPAVLSYAVCGLAPGHAGGHRWEPCGAEYVVRAAKGRDVVEVAIKCTRRGHLGRHAFEWGA